MPARREAQAIAPDRRAERLCIHPLLPTYAPVRAVHFRLVPQLRHFPFPSRDFFSLHSFIHTIILSPLLHSHYLVDVAVLLHTHEMHCMCMCMCRSMHVPYSSAAPHACRGLSLALPGGIPAHSRNAELSLLRREMFDVPIVRLRSDFCDVVLDELRHI